MRKIYIALLSLFIFMAWNFKASAQVSSYAFIQSNGTYTPITGGTVLGTPSANGTSALDDNIYTIATGAFPFTFTYNGIGYTGCRVSTNGFITFGTTAPLGNNYTPLSSNVAYAGAIAGWGTDINSIFNISTQTGEMRWDVIGTAPNRQVVIQYSKFRPAYSSSTTLVFVFDMQIILNENNSVAVVYGNPTALVGTTAIVNTPQVGLRGATNADYNNRTNGTGTPYVNSTAGASNAATQSGNTAVNPPGMPTNGLTYTWFVPGPCAGPISGGTTASSSSPTCPGINFTLSVSGDSFGTGLTFQWESSPDGSTWTPIPSATNATLTTSQTAATYYRRKLSCGASSDYSSAFQVLMNSLTNCYCESSSEDFTFEAIGNVTMTGGINNSSGSTTYTNYSATQVATVYQGQPITLSIGQATDQFFSGFESTDAAYVFIDFNQDGDFTDPGEFVGTASGATSPYVINFNIPPSALLGTTRMRVKFGDTNGFGGLPLDNTPCEIAYAYGETEDYGVTITAPPPCIPPSGLAVSALTATTATVSWTASPSAPSSGYEWELRTFGTGGSGAAGLATSGTTAAGVLTANATGLTANTNYSLWVRSNCGGTIFSAWSGPFSLTTLCPATNVPYLQTFDAAVTPDMPSCVTTQDLNGNSGPIGNSGGGSWITYAGTTQTYTSPLNAIKYQYDAAQVNRPADDWFYIQALNLVGGQSYNLTFNYKASDGPTYVEKLEVKYGLSPDVSAMTSPQIFNNSNINSALANPFSQADVDFIPPVSGTYYIGFHAYSDANQAFLYVDDVSVTITPACKKVTDVSAVSISPTAAKVYFTSPGTNFIVEYGAPGFTPGTGATAGTGGTIVTGTASPISLTGLTASTAYDIYVRQDCGAGSYSDNVATTTTTLCPAVGIPYTQDFESAFAPDMPTCTSSQDVNGNSGSFWNDGLGGLWESYDGDNTTAHSGEMSLIYSYDPVNSARPADDWFYTQGLTLTGGTTYRLKFFYKAILGPDFPEKMEVRYGTTAVADGMTSGTLYTNNNIATSIDDPFDSARVDFTPTTTGTYYIGFHAISDADEGYLDLDDINVQIAPIADVGITAITTPSLTCPTNGIIMTGTIRNYNISAINFALHPITVTTTVAGATTTTFTTVLNSGTLAPNATQDFYLNATPYNFVAGSYVITSSTSSPDDPIHSNDTLRKSLLVNPAPPAAVITPSSVQMCIGASAVKLKTQFTAPPPPVTISATSGTITIPIPDGNTVGINSPLAVTGIPGGAQITNVSVTLNATHTFNSDLIFNVAAPNGSILNLVNEKGGSGDNFTNAIISTSSTTPLPSAATSPITGTFKPDAANGVGPNLFKSNATVNDILGLSSAANGTWTIAVDDNFAFDAGTLNSWSISITYQLLNPTVTWAPLAGLYTDAAATTPYGGGDADSLYVRPASTTTYTVTTTTSAGCKTTTTVPVSVNPIPSVSASALPAKICLSDASIGLSGSPAGGSWTGVGTSGTNFVPSATAVGTYTLTYTYTSAFGCSNTATTTAMVQSCPEREILLRDNAVTLYPNPNDGRFNIRINSTLYNKLGMKVYTSSGILVRTQQFSGLVYGRQIPIDLTNLPGGVYSVQFYYDAGAGSAEKYFNVVIGH